MRPLTLAVKAFRGLTEYVLPLEKRGVILVEGTNEDAAAFDSNGSGKSLATVETLMWCLFGRMLRYGGRPVTDEAIDPRLGAAVSFTFQLGAHTYQVERSRSAKGNPQLSLIVDGTPRPLSKDAAKAQQALVDLLGWDYDSARHAIVIQGGDSLARGGFASQMSVLETILRTRVYADAGEAARADKVMADRTTATARGAWSAAQDSATRAARALAEAETALQSAVSEGDRLHWAGVLAQAQDADRLLPAARTELDESVKLFEAAQAHARDAEAKMMLATSAHREAAQAAEATVCPTCQRPYDQAGNIDELRRLAARKANLLVDAGRVSTTARTVLQGDQRKVEQDKQAVRELELTAARAATAQAKLDGMAQAAKIAQEAAARATLAHAEAEAQVSGHAEAVRTAEAQARKLGRLVEAFGRDAVQADVVAYAAPVLNQAAERYAQALTGGQIGVTFNPIRVSNREDLVRITGGSAPTYDGLSRGEKERVDLVIALALRDLARWRLPESVQLAVYDECFDGMDAAGLEAVAGLLQADAATGATILLVTHNPAFRSLFPGATTLRVVRQNGVATVRYAA